MQETVSLDEAARMIGKSAAFLRRQHTRYTEQYSFPRPLPGRPLRWSVEAIRRWLVYDDVRTPLPAPANDRPDRALLDLVEARLADVMGT